MPVTMMYGVTLTVEAAFSASIGTYGAWDVGTWDAATWGPEELWVDISADVYSITTTRRFSRDLQAWTAGEASVELRNFAGWYSPSNLSGPYVSAGTTQLRPWRPIRITAAYAGVTYPLYRGYVLDYIETYKQPFPGGGGAYVTLPCVDEYAAIAGVDGFEQPPAGAGEFSGARIHRLLNSAGHTGPRNVDVGHVTVQATTLADNVVSEVVLTADSEGGAFWIDADGAAIFDDQLALIEKSRSNTVQVTYGDGPGEMPYSDVRVTNGGELIKNIAAFCRVGGTTQLVSDLTSRALYRDKRATRTDFLCDTDSQVATLASLWLARYAQPERRLEWIQLKPRHDPRRMFPDVLGRRIRDLVRAKRRPPGGHTISSDCHVAGITHTITDDDWITGIEMWSATPWSQFATSLWDTGLWDDARWFF